MSSVGSGSIVSLPEVVVEGFWFGLMIAMEPPIPPAPKPLKFYN